MKLSKLFEKKKEYCPEEERKKKIGEYLQTLEAINELGWIKQEDREESIQFVAEKILQLLPEEVKILEISRDIYAKREDDLCRDIDCSEVKDLEWVEKFCKQKH